MTGRGWVRLVVVLVASTLAVMLVAMLALTFALLAF